MYRNREDEPTNEPVSTKLGEHAAPHVRTWYAVRVSSRTRRKHKPTKATSAPYGTVLGKQLLRDINHGMGLVGPRQALGNGNMLRARISFCRQESILHETKQKKKKIQFPISNF